MPNLLSAEDLRRLYRSLQRIRRFEEEVARVYPSDKIKSPVHLSIGQEALAVGVIDVLTPADIVAASYRGHATYLAKGGSGREMIAEMYGRATGCARGKGGSMHLVSPEVNMLGASAVVGTQIPNAVGAALAQKMMGTAAVVAVFFGDGATEEGVFYESLNFASLHKLPVLFVCENNGYAIHTPLSKRWATERLGERVATFGMPAHAVTDGDVFKIREHAAELVSFIRLGGGPAFLELHAYRWREHVGPSEDFDAGYRSREAAAPWLENDQVTRLAAMVEPTARAAIDEAVEAEITDAFEFAENSPPPDARELCTHVYAS
ncbi:MAG: thiamine pyrophosphate-dependent dehydrogenase E1 component subunit alpha [Candidatus Competibacteraceae bacterium]|nr:thiamine pyrophosphate-dependent dehydrogenase E1 component subunit alpha [Candidatus Competibacteraceae bacterium]